MTLMKHNLPPHHQPKSPETFEYLSTEDIMPSSNPQRDLGKAIQGVGVQDWPEVFHTLTTIRRLSLHHCALLANSR